MKLFAAILILLIVSLASADVRHILDDSELTTLPPPPRPYEFSYTAGRYPGHTDRAHSEVSDGSGVVRGAFSYIDPSQKIRSVEYFADHNGFHPMLSHPINEPQQSEAVKQATIRHINLFNKIAESNANGDSEVPNDTRSVANAKLRHHYLYERIAAEHAQIAAERAAERALFESTSEQNLINETGEGFIDHRRRRQIN